MEYSSKKSLSEFLGNPSNFKVIHDLLFTCFSYWSYFRLGEYEKKHLSYFISYDLLTNQPPG